MKTLLIDGTNLSIIHLTANPATDNNGVPIGMVKGFLGAISWMNITLKPDRVIIFFDGKGNSSQRKKIYSEYKEGRKGKQIVGRYYKFSDQDKADKNRDFQFSILRELLELLPVTIVICNNFETDDAISYAAKYRKFFGLSQPQIVSCDKDFFQLVGDEVSIYNPMSKKSIFKKDIIDEYGIHPKNWLLYRSIAGDESDNLGGVPGVGPKTLLKLFELAKDAAFDLEDLEIACDLSSQDPTQKNKSILKNFHKIKENLPIIKRNWELMDLSNPMIPNSSKEALDAAILESDLKYRKLDFWKKSSEYSIGLNLSLFDDFKFLMRTNK